MLSQIKCTLVATKKYYFSDKLVPTWGLRAHIAHKILNNIGFDFKFSSFTDHDIDKIDFDEIYEELSNNYMLQTTFPSKKGIYKEIDIQVNQVDIDPEWFSGIGIAETMLRDLVEVDKADGSRIIKAEIVVSWSVAEYHGISRKSARDALLRTKPLNDSEPIILVLHGGGYIIGSPGSHRKLAGRISTDTHLRCITIDYRKTPKYPFPAQIHDALISYLHLIKSGFKPENIILAGDSAGGHLALTLLFALRTLNLHKVRGVIVISPVIDLTIPESMSVEENRRYDPLPIQPLHMPTSLQRLFYRPGTKCTPEYLEEVKDPLISPVYGDFSDFPNILIQAGGKEMLLDQSRTLYEKVKAANPDKIVVLEVLEDAIHVPQATTIFPGGEEGFNGIRKFVETILSESKE